MDAFRSGIVEALEIHAEQIEMTESDSDTLGPPQSGPFSENRLLKTWELANWVKGLEPLGLEVLRIHVVRTVRALFDSQANRARPPY